MTDKKKPQYGKKMQTTVLAFEPNMTELKIDRKTTDKSIEKSSSDI